MEKDEVTLEDLERMAAAMAAAIPELECPECCERGWKFEYIELSAQLYQDEHEWACLARALLQFRTRGKPESR